MGLFNQLIEASGLAPVIASGVLSRALERVDVYDLSNLRRYHIFAGRHAIRDALAVYLTVEALHEAMARIERLCRTTSSHSTPVK